MNDNWTPPKNQNHPLNKTEKKQSLIMPSEIQVHRHVPLNDAKISQTTKLALQNLLQEFDLIISKKTVMTLDKWT